jgi:hypothetical protein
MTIKPLKKPGTPPLMQQVRGTSLARFADQLLLDGARILSEGAVERCDGSTPVFHGSTLVTIPLQGRGGADAVARSTPAVLIGAARRSIALHIRLMRLARTEAERRCAPLLPRGMLADIQFNIEGAHLLVDINVECPLAESPRSLADAEATP